MTTKSIDQRELCNDFFMHLQQVAKKPINFTDKTKEVIKNLALYFAKADGPLNLKKGVFLYGPVGTGKTTMMTAFSTWKHTVDKFTLCNTKDIQWGFAEQGFGIVQKYSAKSYRWNNGIFKDSQPLIYCFDDFGNEGKTKHFGNECLVMEEILEYRYREFQINGMKTHVTSNFGKDWDFLEKEYGTRIRSRSREMFNFVELNMEDNRK